MKNNILKKISKYRNNKKVKIAVKVLTARKYLTLLSLMLTLIIVGTFSFSVAHQRLSEFDEYSENDEECMPKSDFIPSVIDGKINQNIRSITSDFDRLSYNISNARSSIQCFEFRTSSINLNLLGEVFRKNINLFREINSTSRLLQDNEPEIADLETQIHSIRQEIKSLDLRQVQVNDVEAAWALSEQLLFEIQFLKRKNNMYFDDVYGYFNFKNKTLYKKDFRVPVNLYIYIKIASAFTTILGLFLFVFTARNFVVFIRKKNISHE